MPHAVPASRSLLPAAALCLNAFIWGVSWWPFRQLQAMGLHPLWSTVVIYAFAVVVITLLRPHALMQVLRTPTLWVLVAAAGTTNAAFNWGAAIGDVVRVVLLFYLMPLWSAMFARLLLRESLTRASMLRIALSMGGAVIVLMPEGGGLPVPQSLPDWLGVIGGMSFALNNVMLRREAQRPQEQRALAMFIGGAVVAGALASAIGAPSPQVPPPFGMALVALLCGCFLLGNLALQYGASRLPVHVSSVVMLTEVVFASGSAVLLGTGVLTPAVAVGGALIVAAALLASTAGSSAHAA